jgi:O-antigen/teichoic acid export membrane protein
MARARARGDHAEVRGAARIGLAGAGIASLIVMVVLLAGADGLASFFFLFRRKEVDEAEFARLIRIASPYVPLFALMQVLRYCTQAYKTVVPSVIVGGIVQPLARFVLGVAFLVAGFGVAGAISSLAASAGVGALAGAWFYRRILTSDERAATPQASVGEMVRFALPQAGSSLLGIQSLGLGIIVVGLLSSEAEVAVFGVALALQGPGGVFLGGMVNIWAPVVSDLYDRGEIARLESLYQTITRWIATFSFPVFAALIVEGDVFVQVMTGREDDRIIAATALLAVGNFFFTGTGPTGYVLSMTGRPGVNAINSAVGVALYIAGGFWVVPDHGAVGMAAVDAVVTALINSARVVEAKLLVGVQPFGKSFTKPVMATAIGAGAVLLWKLIPGDNAVLDITGICLGALAFLGALRLLGLDREERYVIEQVRSRIFRRGGGKRRGHRIDR